MCCWMKAPSLRYLNTDIANELVIQGHCQSRTVNVLNRQTETFETMPVEVKSESWDGNVKMMISAFTAERVRGNVKVIYW